MDSEKEILDCPECHEDIQASDPEFVFGDGTMHRKISCANPECNWAATEEWVLKNTREDAMEQ